jgi:stage IV sporulation protein B
MKANTFYKTNGTKPLKIIIFILLIFTLLLQSAVYSLPITIFDDGIEVSTNELEDMSMFPINCSVDEDGSKAIIKFKLFDLFTIKSVEANIVDEESVYLGGSPLGISLKPAGVIIAGKTDVVTENGLKSPTKDSDIIVGDVLYKLNQTEVRTLIDIRNFLKTNNDTVVEAKIRRMGKDMTTTIMPAKDSLTGEKKLGLFIKEEITGVGTLTYVDKNMSYGALGHSVSAALVSDEQIKGEIYSCTIVDVKKGEKGNAGELKGNFSKNDKLGNIIKSNSFGIYGNAINDICASKQTIKKGGRMTAHVGKAEIWTTLSGCEPKGYEVEIIKVNYQKSESEKGMVIRVTDKELLERSGGIVQGMSGSPIVQDGKLIGAVTHVFLNDPAKGYGIFIDWMK